MTPLMTVEDHELAIAAAAMCDVCSRPSDATLVVNGPEACLCCRQLVDHYSCAPGFCPRCAHDPRTDEEQAAISDELSTLVTHAGMRTAIRVARLRRRRAIAKRRPPVRAGDA